MFKPLIFALAPAALFAVPAVAAPANGEFASVDVGYADLDLASGAGQTLLAQRVERAAKDACKKPSIRDLKGMRSYEGCVAGIMEQAKGQLSVSDAPAAAALAAL